MGFKVGGLIFDSKDDYQLFKDIDRNIIQTAKLVKDGSIDLKEFFNKIKRINVKESYYDACKEMDDLFKNAKKLFSFKIVKCNDDYNIVKSNIDYKVGFYFFDKINIVEYSESESNDF